MKTIYHVGKKTIILMVTSVIAPSPIVLEKKNHQPQIIIHCVNDLRALYFSNITSLFPVRFPPYDHRYGIYSCRARTYLVIRALPVKNSHSLTWIIQMRSYRKRDSYRWRLSDWSGGIPRVFCFRRD